MSVSKEDVRNLIRLFEDSDWIELRLEVEGLKLVVSKSGPGAASPAVTAAPASVPVAAAAALAAPAAAVGASAIADATLATGQVLVRAPNLGVFWKQPKPGAPAYVQAGDAIEADTTICLIEVMKLFTPVKAGRAGRVVRCLVEDGDMVEHDTPLFVVQQ